MASTPLAEGGHRAWGMGCGGRTVPCACYTGELALVTDGSGLGPRPACRTLGPRGGWLSGVAIWDQGHPWL